MDWGAPEVGLFHPPVGLVVRVLRYAEACGARDLLVVPDWPGSVFGAVLREKEDEGKVVLVDRFRPWLEAPMCMTYRTFKGIPAFDFLAFRLNF